MHRIALLHVIFLAKSLAPKAIVTAVSRSIQEMTSDLIKRGTKLSKNDILSKWLEEGSQNAYDVAQTQVQTLTFYCYLTNSYYAIILFTLLHN